MQSPPAAPDGAARSRRPSTPPPSDSSPLGSPPPPPGDTDALPPDDGEPLRSSGIRPSPHPGADGSSAPPDGLPALDERELRQAHRMEVVGQMVSGVAHDLANILTAIQGFAELAAEVPPSEVGSLVGEIRATAERGTTLTRKLLAVGRSRASRAVALDVNDCVAEVETLVRRVGGPDLEIVTDLESPLPRVNAAAHDVEMVLLNLVLNARDAVAGAGEIRIATRAEAPTREGEWAWIALEVSDSGTGMDAATLEQIFEPFFTTKGEGVGTGLGLAVVADIVGELGGAITVDSAPGRGTTMTVRLPAPDDEGSRPGAAAGRAADDAATSGVAGGWGETLLLCDDDPGVVRMLASALRRVGYEVLESHGPHEAIAAFHERKGDVDLLVTDVMMPELTGEELLAQLRMGRSDLRAVLLTGYTRDGLHEHGVQLASEGEVLLQKPFGPDELRRAVRQALDAPEGES